MKKVLDETAGLFCGITIRGSVLSNTPFFSERRQWDSDPRSRFCRPTPYHLAMSPFYMSSALSFQAGYIRQRALPYRSFNSLSYDPETVKLFFVFSSRL